MSKKITVKSSVEIPQKELDEILEQLSDIKSDVFFVFNSQALSDRCDVIIAQLQGHSANSQENHGISP